MAAIWSRGEEDKLVVWCREENLELHTHKVMLLTPMPNPIRRDHTDMQDAQAHCRIVKYYLPDVYIQVIAQLPKDTINTGSVPVDVLIPHLQTLLQQTVSQQEHIVSLLSSLHKKDATMAAYQYAKCPSQFLNGESDISVETTTEREQILHSKIAELQAKILSLTDESRAVKARNIQLQQQLIAIYHQEEEDKIQKEERVKDP